LKPRICRVPLWTNRTDQQCFKVTYRRSRIVSQILVGLVKLKNSASRVWTSNGMKTEPREAIPLVLKMVGEVVFQTLPKPLSACQANVGWAILVKKDVNALLVTEISHADVSPVGTDPPE